MSEHDDNDEEAFAEATLTQAIERARSRPSAAPT